MYGSADPMPMKTEDQLLRARHEAAIQRPDLGASPKSPDEPEVITSFSWRNFFSVVNFVHILQKLTKRKAHRILLLVQYKSSVGLPTAYPAVTSTHTIILGYTQAYSQGITPFTATLRVEGRQVPNTLLRAEMATV